MGEKVGFKVEEIIIARRSGRLNKVFVIQTDKTQIPEEFESLVYYEWNDEPSQLAKQIADSLTNFSLLTPFIM